MSCSPRLPVMSSCMNAGKVTSFVKLASLELILPKKSSRTPEWGKQDGIIFWGNTWAVKKAISPKILQLPDWFQKYHQNSRPMWGRKDKCSPVASLFCDIARGLSEKSLRNFLRYRTVQFAGGVSVVLTDFISPALVKTIEKKDYREKKKKNVEKSITSFEKSHTSATAVIFQAFFLIRRLIVRVPAGQLLLKLFCS
jgi:hypothetical protein